MLNKQLVESSIQAMINEIIIKISRFLSNITDNKDAINYIKEADVWLSFDVFGKNNEVFIAIRDALTKVLGKGAVNRADSTAIEQELKSLITAELQKQFINKEGALLEKLQIVYKKLFIEENTLSAEIKLKFNNALFEGSKKEVVRSTIDNKPKAKIYNNTGIDDPRKYNDNDITDYKELIIRNKLGGYRIFQGNVTCQFLLNRTFQDGDKDYLVTVTDSIDTASTMLPIDYYLDKTLQPSTIARALNIIIPVLDTFDSNQGLQEQLKRVLFEEEFDDGVRANILQKMQEANFEKRLLEVKLHEAGGQLQRRDVFEEVMPELLKADVGYAKIIFPYNRTHIHWMSGEIKISKRGHHYNVGVYAHDPYGHGKMASDSYESIRQTIERRIRNEDRSATVTCSNETSVYTRRQMAGDGISCGIITAEDIIKLIQGESLNIEVPYEYGTLRLREKHVQEFLPYNTPERERFNHRFEAAKKALTSGNFSFFFPQQQVSIGLDLSVSEKDEVIGLIQSIKNQDLRETIINAMSNRELYGAKDGSYIVGVQTAIEQKPAVLNSEGIVLDEEDIKAINELHKSLFGNQGNIKGNEDLIFQIGSGLTKSAHRQFFSTTQDNKKSQTEETRLVSFDIVESLQQEREIRRLEGIRQKEENNLKIEELAKRLEDSLGKIEVFFGSKKYDEASKVIKEALLAIKYDREVNLNKECYYDQEYKLFMKLGELYLLKGDVKEYPKTIAIYQYLHKFVDKIYQDSEKKAEHEELDKNIGLVEEEYIGKVTRKKVSQGYGVAKLIKIREKKKYLEEYRGVEGTESFDQSIKARLKAIDELGIKEGQEELDEEGLKERARIVEEIYGEIRKFFIGERGVIKQLLLECIDELGGVPLVGVERKECEYAIFGMGSMSLGTMTPWSDIEFGILIEEKLSAEDEKRIKEFFRNVTALLNIKIIMFGESVLHYQGIKELNNFSTEEKDDWFRDTLQPKGFCFDATLPDGCKTPLGREGCAGYEDYELINNPRGMLEFQQDSKWQVKDMQLVQALWHTILIVGSEELLAQYQRSLNKELIKKHSFMLLKEDAQVLDPLEKIENKEKLSQILKIKKEVYRFIDRMVVAIGDCLDGKGESSWELARSSNTQDTEEEELHDDLQLALSIATELRLRTYANNNGREEYVSASAKYKSQLKELNTNGLESQEFHLKDIKILYRYYWIVSYLSLRIAKIYDEDDLQHIGWIKYSIGDHQRIGIMAFVCKKFLRYHDAIKKFESLATEHIPNGTLAWLYMQIGKYEEALKYYEKELNLKRSSYTPDYTGIIASLSMVGISLSELGRYEEALEFQTESLSLSWQVKPNYHASAANSLKNKGDTLEKLARYEEALFLQQESLKEMRNEYKGDHADVARSLKSVGNTLHKLKRHVEALKYYHQSLDMQKRVDNGDHAEIADSLCRIGDSLTCLGKNDEALQYYNQSLTMRRKNYNGDHTSIADTLRNIGDNLAILGRDDEAFRYHNKSSEMQSRIYKNRDTLFVNLNNRKNSLEMLMKHERLLEQQREALKSRKIIVDYSNDIERYLDDIVNVLRKLGRREEALKYSKKNLEMRRKIHNGVHNTIVVSLSQVGNILDELERHEEAITYHLEALKMMQVINKNDNIGVVASFLCNIGNSLAALGKYEEALKYQQESIEIMQKIGSHYGVAKSMENISKTLLMLGRHAEAFGFSQQSLEIKWKIYKSDHIDIVTSLRTIGKVLSKLERYEEALKYLKEGLEMIRRIYKVDHVDIVDFLNDIGNILQNLNSYEEALKYHKEGLEMVRKIYKGNHANVAELSSHENESDENFMGFSEQGVMSFRNKDYNRSIEAFGRALSTTSNPPPELFYNRGRAFQENGEIEFAVEDYNIAIERKPDYAKAYYQLGVCKQREGNLTGAKSCFEQALQIDQTYYVVQEALQILEKEEKDLSDIVNQNCESYEKVLEQQQVTILLNIITKISFKAYLRSSKNFIVDAVYQIGFMDKAEDYLKALSRKHSLPFILKDSDEGYQIVLKGVNIPQVSNLVLERFKSRDERARTIN